MFKFRPSTIPTNIFVVGCGGTGSRLIPPLVQFIRSITKEHNPTGWLGSTNIILVDGDIVEQKNLLRQNFIVNDVNKNKAAVLALRYGKAYDMNVVAYPKFIEEGMTPSKFRTDLNETSGVIMESHMNDMVIMCVDSAKARRIVMKALAPISPSKRTVFIDAGNEDSFGQVRMFTNDILYAHGVTSPQELKDNFKKPERIAYTPEPFNYIPYDHAFYETLQDNPGLGSCADLDQTLAINSLMAMLILSFVQNYYYNKVIDYNQVSIDIVAGATNYTKNDLTNYRNSTIIGTGDIARIGSGASYGLIGMCTGHDAVATFNRFLTRNKVEVDKIQRAMDAAMKKEEPKIEEIEVAPKKRRSKKEEIELTPVVSEQVETIPEGANTAPTVTIEPAR